MILIQLDIKDN